MTDWRTWGWHEFTMLLAERLPRDEHVAVLEYIFLLDDLSKPRMAFDQKPSAVWKDRGDDIWHRFKKGGYDGEDFREFIAFINKHWRPSSAVARAEVSQEKVGSFVRDLLAAVGADEAPPARGHIVDGVVRYCELGRDAARPLVYAVLEDDYANYPRQGSQRQSMRMRDLRPRTKTLNG